MGAMSVVEARRSFSELVTRVAYGGSRVVVERRGRSLAALISVQDLAKLEVWEREHDTAHARQRAALAQAAPRVRRSWPSAGASCCPIRPR